MCRVYKVSKAGFYAWRARLPSEHAKENAELLKRIQTIHADSGGIYGSPRVQQCLLKRGCRVSKNRVARLMRKAKLCGRSAKLYRRSPGTATFYHGIANCHSQHPALVPNQVWVADLTYLRMPDGWRYLATVMDRCSRRIIGWTLKRTRNVQLTLAALNHAVHRRRPRRGVIFHTDRGIEYAAYPFRDRLRELGLEQSMNCQLNDNAHMESFFHSMKTDVIHGRTFTTDRQLSTTINNYIHFYNEHRVHSSLQYVSPAAYERMLAKQGVY
jgi:putative transposase